MLRRWPLIMLTIVAFNLVVPVAADESRARINYVLNCQGCHLADAGGTTNIVPRMKDFLGYFLQVEGGREFIVRVPGVSGAPLTDDEIAELMNWVLANFSRQEIPAGFKPYTTAEVARLRNQPLLDVGKQREILIGRMRSELGINDDGLGGS